MNDTLNRREAGHPRETYQTPTNVMSDDDLSSKQKINILQYWKMDVVARLTTQHRTFFGEGEKRPLLA